MSNKKELLVEKRLIPLNHETTNDGKDVYISGIFLQADVVNANGRYYPGDVMQEAVDRYVSKNMSNGRNTAWGALDHPDDPEMKLADVSHIFVELERDGSNWIGKAKIGDTEKGKIAKELIKMGGTLGTSSRASGEVDEGRGPGGSDLITDLDFITIGDIVANPSAPDAYVESIMESTKWILKNGVWTQEQLHNAQKHIRKANTSRKLKESKMQVAAKLFESINKILNNK